MHTYEVLRRPIVSEKSIILQGQSKYMFEVASAANKHQIKEAVEKAFKVDVLGVNVVTVHGSMRKIGKRRIVTSAWKKAVVTVKAGQKIEFFEGV
jgi:large subunit ribosomal protein L23